MRKWIIAAGLICATAAQAAPPPRAIRDVQRLALQSNSAQVVDQQTGQVLYAKRPDQVTSIASITKLMTGVVTLDAHLPMNQMITILPEDVDTLRHSASRLPVGTTLPRWEMMLLALMASENRAAASLARTYPGGLPACINAMNRKARELGMWHTHYVEGTGLNDEDVSTAQDLARLVNAASHYAMIRQISGTGGYHVALPRRGALEYHNSDPLVRDPHWSIGVSKTGFINEAGHCLVMQTIVSGRPIIIVLLNSPGLYSRVADAIRVKRWLETQPRA